MHRAAPPPAALPHTFDKGSISVPILDGSNYSVLRKAMRALFIKTGVLPLVEMDTLVPHAQKVADARKAASESDTAGLTKSG